MKHLRLLLASLTCRHEKYYTAVLAQACHQQQHCMCNHMQCGESRGCKCSELADLLTSCTLFFRVSTGSQCTLYTRVSSTGRKTAGNAQRAEPVPFHFDKRCIRNPALGRSFCQTMHVHTRTFGHCDISPGYRPGAVVKPPQSASSFWPCRSA